MFWIYKEDRKSILGSWLAHLCLEDSLWLVYLPFEVFHVKHASSEKNCELSEILAIFKHYSKIIHFKHISMFSWSDTFFITWSLEMSGKAQDNSKKSILHKYNIWHSCNAKWYNVSIPDGKQKEWTQINLYFLYMQFNCFKILTEIILVKSKHLL